MRLAVVSDTHLPRGSRVIPARALELMRGADAILHAGDFFTREAYEQIAALGPPLHAVHGNVDTAELRELLPASRQDRFGGATIAMTHIPPPPGQRVTGLRARFPDADAVVYGHTHMPEHLHAGEFQAFNPGSPTERRRAPAHTMGIATVEGARVTFELVTL